jgi:sporulation protein YlmC with PRC-barrel domain
MLSKYVFGGLLAAMLTTTALAQSQSPATPPAAPATIAPAPMAQAGHWRSSKLIGVDVYNDQNEKLGDIDEILLDQSGKVAGVVLGVGGFLGVGEHYVMVSFDKLNWVNEPIRTSSTTTTTTTPGASGPVTTTVNRPVRAANEKWYPDHAVLSGATKDQLKSMQQFEYN